MIVIGRSRKIRDVEVVQEGMDRTCRSVPSFPYYVDGHSATMIPTGILVCGGSRSSYTETQCRLVHGSRMCSGIRLIDFKKNLCTVYKKKEWQSFHSMTTERSSFDMKFLNGHIWAIGGWGHKSTRKEDTLEKFDLHTYNWTKHKIPFYVANHCQTKLTLDKLIVIGGQQTGPVSEK